MGRSAAREEAVKFIYQCDMRSTEPERAVEDYYGSLDKTDDADEYVVLNKRDKQFMLTLLCGAWEKRNEIDAAIAENSKGWDVGRLSRVLHGIIRIAVYEMLYREDIPISVSINEAVELAKKYENEDKSSIFLNGVLSGVAKKCGGKTI